MQEEKSVRAVAKWHVGQVSAGRGCDGHSHQSHAKQ